MTLQPLTTSNYFAPGHRLRIEVSSSNFPRFDRNLNTGGNNYDETERRRGAQLGAPLEAVPVADHRDRRAEADIDAPVEPIANYADLCHVRATETQSTETQRRHF